MPQVAVFVVDTTGGGHALSLTDELWRAGIRADRAYENRSMKAQMKVADRSGAAVALIVGGDEAAAGVVTLRPLRRVDGETATQRQIARADVIDELKRTL